MGLPPSRQGRLRHDHPQALDASCCRPGHTPRDVRRGRPAQQSRRLLDHRLGKKFTISPRGHPITPVALESPECTPARKPLPNSVTTTEPRLSAHASFLHRRPRPDFNNRAMTGHPDRRAFPARRIARRRLRPLGAARCKSEVTLRRRISVCDRLLVAQSGQSANPRRHVRRPSIQGARCDAQERAVDVAGRTVAARRRAVAPLERAGKTFLARKARTAGDVADRSTYQGWIADLSEAMLKSKLADV